MMIQIWFIFVLINKIAAISYNQPRFCPNTTWNLNGITIATQNIVGIEPRGIFVSSKNSIYVPNRQTCAIHIWVNGSMNPTKNISGNLSDPHSIFVTNNGDIYVDNGNNSRVDKWMAETNTWATVMSVTSTCCGLFVDIRHNLYCSIFRQHQVVKKWLNDTKTITQVAAGTGVQGNALNSLHFPCGIFVDINLHLYVADGGNDRIQLFRSGELSGTTVVGQGSTPSTINLRYPGGIVLDGDQHLFIADDQNHRIIGSDENGFRCIIACSGSSGSSSDKLTYPASMSFDSYGNIYVTDQWNSRIQKFVKNNFSNRSTIISTTRQISTEEKPSTIMATSPIITTTALDSTQKETTAATSRLLTTTTPSFISEENCFSPQITLIPNANSPETPLQYRRSQDFYILSRVELNCKKSFSTIKNWSIRNSTRNNYSEMTLKKKLTMTNSELYIPSNTLPYGIYQFELKVSMSDYPTLTSSSSIYVEISPSGITANLVPLGTSVITSGHEQNLTLNPGKDSTDPDGYLFNASDWLYVYFCRIYERNQRFLPIDSCLSNQSNVFEYNGVELSRNSSLTIFEKVLQLNKTYQFLVQMSNRRNASLQVTGYVLVEIKDSNRPMIAIGCVIASLCAPNLEFQKVNPTTQVALYSSCVNQCPNPQNIIWNIYHGTTDSTQNYTQWKLFNQMNDYENLWFYGRNTMKFTATNDLFVHYSNETYWKFEVIYSFQSMISLSALNFEMNQPPSNGSCQINPTNGTTNTLFHITCSDWLNKDNIKEYSLFTWTNDQSKLQIISFSPISTFEVRLPVGENLNLVIHIRDTLDSIAQYHLSSVNITFDSFPIEQNHSLIQLLASGNQRTIGQIITLLTHQFDQIKNQTIDKAISNGIPLTTISISSLGSQRLTKVNLEETNNQSARLEFLKENNIQANLREYYIQFTDNLTITSANSFKLQSLSIVQLTNATNQLTRTTLLFAFNKCFQLTHQLASWLNKLPFEDIQIIATQLLQCASNILTAVNGPLQKRIEVLEKDSTLATSPPADYDTDLDLEWSNPYLFADGDDFSWNTLQKGKIFYFQKKLADEFNEKINQMISLLTSSFKLHLNIGQHYTINTSEVFMSLETMSIKSLYNKTLKQVADAQILIPMNFSSNCNPNQTISLRSMMQPMSVYGQSRLKTINTNLSTSISLSILDENGTEIPFETNHLTPIEFFIPHDPNLEIPPMIPTNQSFHYVNLTSDLPISVHFEINADFAYLFIYKFDGLPISNSSMQNVDGLMLVNQTNFTYMISNQQTIGHQYLIFALLEQNSTKSNYELRVYTSGCFYLDKNKEWKSDGLTVGPLTNLYQTHCYSTHLTTFSGSIQILPPKIDFDFAFANADFHRNRTIYLTVIIVTLIYILVMIYARRKDRQDSDELVTIPLADNRRDDHYDYQILVLTGQRKDSGTDSKVHFILNGEQDHTFVRTFSNSQSRKIFQRGQIDSFLMSVRQSLGPLNYLHIWHDDSGQGSKASWFLKCVIVRDLQTMETCYFIVQKWFAVEKDDGKVERVFPVASESEKEQFSYLLSKKTYSKLSDEHLWFSIFFRSPTNQFSRVQRCTCCFVLFFLSMFFNILYYDLNQQKQSINQIQFGPFLIPLQQIASGIIIEFFSFIISLCLVEFFRRIRTRSNRISPLNETLTKKMKLTFPWWSIYLAYGLSILLILTSIFLIIIRGIEFGNEKSQQWLISILIGFVSSIFVSQPLKILILSLIFILFCRKQNQEDEVYLQSKVNQTNHHQSSNQKSSPTIHQIRLFEDRLTKEYRQATRVERMRDIHMYSFLQQSITYLVFFVLLCLIVYPNQNQMHFYQVKHLKTFFRFDHQISTIDQYYSWLEKHFVDNLRAQIWYNQKDLPKNLTGFMNDKTNRLIGWATMRQLRVKTQLCFDQRLINHCHYDYSFSNQEKRSFYPNWTTDKEEENDYSSTIVKAFQYQSSSTGGYVYEFRGSLFDLRTNLTQLHQFNWIDQKTRAVFLQLTLYNPNLQLFTSLTFLTEFFSTGHIQSQIRIQPMDFLSFTSLFQFVCLLLYLLTILYFMWIQLRCLFDLKWKYFSRFWSYVQLGIIICSWTGVSLYLWRYKESQRIARLFKQTHGYFYIDLQVAAYVNDFLTFLFGFCCFFGTIQFYHLCRFNQRLTLFDKTLQHSANDLGHFSLMFVFIFLPFVCLFYLLFSSQIQSYATFATTAQILFEMSLSKFDAKELLNVDSFLGPFCFSLFMIFIVFICMGMFISIINDSFQSVRKKKDIQPEVYSYMLNKFLRWTRIKKPTLDEIQEEIDKVMRSEYVHRIDHLMNRAQVLSNIADKITSN